jgi:TQXA domain-containing protein
MLRNNTNLTEAQITTLTPGMALTATQAAIWYYGNSSTKSQINYSNLADGYRITPYTYGGYTYNGTYLSNEQKTVLTTLCNYLINLSSSKVADTSTTLVTEENFAKKVSITLKDVTTENNTTKYTADISFSLDMTPTATDDLTISLLDSNGKKLTSKKLSEAATSNSRIYTLQNVTLAAGTTVTLQLTGTQELDEGAYLYSADAYQTSQTFVGVAQGTRNVDLSVNLSVGEEVPQAWVAYEGKAVTTNTTATRLIGDISVNVQLKTDVTTTHAQVTETTEKTETTVETTPIIRDYPTTPSTTKKEEEPETTEEPKETEEPQETEEPAPTETPDPTETPEPTPEPSETPEEPEEKIDEPSEVVTEELPDGSEEEIITYPDDVTVDVIITPEHTVTVTIDVPDDFTPEKVAIPIDYGPEDGTVGAEIRRPEQPVEDTRLDYVDGEVLVEVDGPMEIEIFDDFVPVSAMPELEEETVILEEEPVDIQPNTGDDRQILLLLSLVLLSGSALAVLTTRRVRRS